MTPLITVLAYMENGASYARGCLMESWGSDFATIMTRDVDQAIKDLGDYKIANFRASKVDDTGTWDFTVLIDGADEEFSVDEPEEIMALRDRVINESDKIASAYAAGERERLAAAERAHDAAVAAEARRKKQAEIDDLRRRVDEDTLAENRARLARLEAEMGGDA